MDLHFSGGTPSHLTVEEISEITLFEKIYLNSEIKNFLENNGINYKFCENF